MPWLDDKDGMRLDIVENLVSKKMPHQALSIIADLRSDGVNKPILDLFQGQALQYQGLQSEAERLLVQARKKMPGDARPPAALCVLYADSELYEKAIESCQRATTLDKRDAVSWNNYGYLLLMTTDRSDDAQEALQRAIGIDSTQARYRNNLGHAQVANGKLDDAFKTFMSTATRADAAYNTGAAIERFREGGDPVAYYEKAIEHQPDHRMAHDALERLTLAAEEN